MKKKERRKINKKELILILLFNWIKNLSFSFISFPCLLFLFFPFFFQTKYAINYFLLGLKLTFTTYP